MVCIEGYKWNRKTIHKAVFEGLGKDVFVGSGTWIQIYRIANVYVVREMRGTYEHERREYTNFRKAYSDFNTRNFSQRQYYS